MSPVSGGKRAIMVLAVMTILPLLYGAGWSGNWESIRKAMSGVRSISADFTQKKNLRILARPLVSTGRFYYRAPGDLRWEYTAPLRNILLVHGDNVAMYTWASDRFTKDEGPQIEATRIVMEQIASWLNGNFNDNRAFVPRLVQGSPARIILVPARHDFTKFIQRITLNLSPDSGVISSIEIQEPQGSSTTIDFSHIALNTPLADRTFEKVR